MINLLAGVIGGGGSPGKVTVTEVTGGSKITDTQGNPTTAITKILLNTDGTIDKLEQVTTTQLNSGTDWLIPNAEAPSLFEAHMTMVSGDNFTVGALDTWILISDGNIQWRYQKGTVGVLNGVGTLSIRFNGGPVLDSANFEMLAEQT